MKLGHAVGARPLEPHHRHAIARQLSRLERCDDILLIVENNRWRFDHMMLRFHGGSLDDRPTEISGQQSKTTVIAERIIRGTQYVQITARRRRRAPRQTTVLEPRLERIR